MALVFLNRPAIKEELVRFTTPLVNKVVDLTLARARTKAPVHIPRPFDERAPGELRRSLTRKPLSVTRDAVRGAVGSRKRYAMSVHEGAGAHHIVARRAPLLVFYWQRENVTFVGHSVRHPGIRHGSTTEYLWYPLLAAARENGFAVRAIKPGTQQI